MADFVPRGPSSDVDAPTHGRIARTFYVYRLVRYSVVGLIALVAVPVTAAGGAPWWVPVLCVVLAALMGLSLWQTRRRWQRARSTFEA